MMDADHTNGQTVFAVRSLAWELKDLAGFVLSGEFPKVLARGLWPDRTIKSQVNVSLLIRTTSAILGPASYLKFP